MVQPGAHPGYRAFPQLPDLHAQAIPRLCYVAEDKDAGMYSLDGQPKTVEEVLDRMQFFQHSRQGRPPKPKHDVRAVPPRRSPKGWGMVPSLMPQEEEEASQTEGAVPSTPLHRVVLVGRTRCSPGRGGV